MIATRIGFLVSVFFLGAFFLSFTAPPASAMVDCEAKPKRLDDHHFLGLQTEIEDIEIFAHVPGVGGPGKGHHADIDGEPENDLADGPTVAFGH